MSDFQRFHVEVLEPTSLVPAGCTARAAFEAVWPLLGIDAAGWHRSLRLDADGGLFVKGLYVGATANPQHFLRRCHVRNEARNLRVLRARGGLDLAVPALLAWGCESRFGLPVYRSTGLPVYRLAESEDKCGGRRPPPPDQGRSSQRR